MLAVEIEEQLFPNLPAGDLLVCREVCASWRRSAERAEQQWAAEVAARFPTMAKGLADSADTEGPLDWFALFRARCERARAWSLESEAKKAKKQERASVLQERAARASQVQKDMGSTRGRERRPPKKSYAPESSSGSSTKPIHGAREKTCSRCAKRFIPSACLEECQHHPGKFLELDPRTGQPKEMTKDWRRYVQENLRRAAQGKTPLARAVWGQPVDGEADAGAGAEGEWSCCGARVLLTAGCTLARHC